MDSPGMQHPGRDPQLRRLLDEPGAQAQDLVVERDGRGKIRLDVLGATASPERIADWIHARMLRVDPHGLVDVDTKPEDLFVNLWRRCENEGTPESTTADLKRILEKGLLLRLQAEWKRHKPRSVEERDALESLLSLAAITAPASAKNWLLQTVAEKASERPDLRDHDFDLRWLEVAARQRPDMASKVWKKLLDDPRYARVAFLALRHQPQAAAYLQAYWRAIPETERRSAIEDAVLDLRRHHDGSAVLSSFVEEAYASRWPQALKDDVDAALTKHEEPALFAEELEKSMTFGEMELASQPSNEPPKPARRSYPPSSERRSSKPPSTESGPPRASTG